MATTTTEPVTSASTPATGNQRWQTYGPGGPEVWYKRHAKRDGDDVDDKFDVSFGKTGALRGFLLTTLILLALQYFAFDPQFRYLIFWLAPLTLVPLALWRWISPKWAIYTLLGWLRKTGMLRSLC